MFLGHFVNFIDVFDDFLGREPSGIFEVRERRDYQLGGFFLDQSARFRQTAHFTELCANFTSSDGGDICLNKLFHFSAILHIFRAYLNFPLNFRLVVFDRMLRTLWGCHEICSHILFGSKYIRLPKSSAFGAFYAYFSSKFQFVFCLLETFSLPNCIYKYWCIQLHK